MTDKQIRDRIVGVLSASMMPMEMEAECTEWVDKHLKRTFACGMCDNAYTNPELTHYNDLSCFSLGKFESGKRMMFRSGDHRPTELIIEELKEDRCWHLIGKYIPKCCPNCGRELIENRRYKNEFI